MAFANQFKNQVIALTGAASGIGLATAHLLASRGATLSLADLSSTGLAAAAESLRTKYNLIVLTTTLDVRSYAAVEAWIQATVARFGRLDGAANLAGVIPKSIGVATVEEVEEEEWEFVLGVNLTGVMHCVKAQLKVMGDKASIVNELYIALGDDVLLYSPCRIQYP